MGSTDALNAFRGTLRVGIDLGLIHYNLLNIWSTSDHPSYVVPCSEIEGGHGTSSTKPGHYLGPGSGSDPLNT